MATPGRSRKKGSRSLWLLTLPYLGLLFPDLYARTVPVWLGFPFFYWYQFFWVLLAAALMGLVYLRIRD